MKPYKILQGDNRETLLTLRKKSIQTCVTSPPYWQLRNYAGEEKQIGLEKTWQEFIHELVVGVFAPIHEALRDDGTLWVNMGDGYSDGKDGFRVKNLQGIPWRLAFALQDWGWNLRQDIIWHKITAMPESGRLDRCSKAHEYIFLFSKKPDYFFDNHAIREKTGNESTPEDYAVALQPAGPQWYQRDVNPFEDGDKSGNKQTVTHPDGKAKRTVWPIAGEASKIKHFAMFPRKLVTPCIKSGTSEKGCCRICETPIKRIVESKRIATRPGINNKSEGKETEETGKIDIERHTTEYSTKGWEPGCSCGSLDNTKPCVVLDPFSGSGTTVATAIKLGRRAIGCELSAEYIGESEKKIAAAMESTGFGIS